MIPISRTILVPLLLALALALSPARAFSGESNETPAPAAKAAKTDADRINDVHAIAEIIERYHDITGKYPFQENWDIMPPGYKFVPITVNITDQELPPKYLVPVPGNPGSVLPTDKFENYLSAVLGEKITLPYDDRDVRQPNCAPFHQFYYDGKRYLVSAVLENPTPDTRTYNKVCHKYTVGSQADPEHKILKYTRKKEQ